MTKKKDAITMISDLAKTLIKSEAKMFLFLDKAVKEMSLLKHGNEAGNITAQDIGAKLKEMEISPSLAKELSRGAAKRHELFRWSEEGKRIQLKAKESV